MFRRGSSHSMLLEAVTKKRAPRAPRAPRVRHPRSAAALVTAQATAQVVTGTTVRTPTRHVEPAVLEDSVESPALLLDDEQRRVVEAARDTADNLFITGAAGTGKSRAIDAIVSVFGRNRVILAAPTGVAAHNIGGRTLHSVFGLSPAPKEAGVDMQLKGDVSRTLSRCNVIIIDEISMVAPRMLSAVDVLCQRYRRRDTPFGGIRVVVCGDFLQLPPVENPIAGIKYCFQSESWERAAFRKHTLVTCHRQARDAEFQRFLARVRVGDYDPKVIEGLATNQQPPNAMLLRSTNSEVQAINTSRFEAIGRPVVGNYVLQRGSCLKPHLVDAAFARLPRLLQLKIGCRVMLLANLDVGRGLINGARGTVIDFTGAKEPVPVVHFDNGVFLTVQRRVFSYEELGVVVCSVSQVPLALGWACTVHKSQGMTLPSVDLDLSRSFEAGQAYVGLTRAVTMAGLQATGLLGRKPMAPCPIALKFDAQ